jgi:hypothetical protein
MDGFNLNKIPKTYFVLDFKGPGGYIPLGYTKYTLPIMMQYKLQNPTDKQFTGYYASVHNPTHFFYNTSSEFSNYVTQYTKNTEFVLTKDIKDNIKSNNLYLVVFESLNVNNMFEYYSSDKIVIEDMISPDLLNLIKNNTNFKIVFVDSGEGAYTHNISFLEKIHEFLKRNDINHTDKVYISTNNNNIIKLKNSKKFPTFKNQISVFPNNYLITSAGRFMSILRSGSTHLIQQDGYDYSFQTELKFNKKQKKFLMYNRNSERMHRAYFLNLLYKNHLLDKGFISFLENLHFVKFLNEEKEYPPLGLTQEDTLDIKRNYKNYYPLVIDDDNPDRVAEYHNFLSRKDEYENSYFTIISETNAESPYSFLTEKTIKPIMNLHPFVVLGNPNTLDVLKSHGFKTFDKWWDESYDNIKDFKTRADLLLNLVISLCNKTDDEWIEMLKEMEETLIYNQKLLHKLSTEKREIKNFFENILHETQML